MTHRKHTFWQVSLQLVDREHDCLKLMLLKQTTGDGAGDVGVAHHQAAQVGGLGQHLHTLHCRGGNMGQQRQKDT